MRHSAYKREKYTFINVNINVTRTWPISSHLDWISLVSNAYVLVILPWSIIVFNWFLVCDHVRMWKRNAFVPDKQHGDHDVTGKPASSLYPSRNFSQLANKSLLTTRWTRVFNSMELRNYYGDIFIMICLKFITSLSDVNVIYYSYLSVDIVFKKIKWLSWLLSKF